MMREKSSVAADLIWSKGSSVMTRHTDMQKKFKALHAEARGFVMPNAWDAGSAIVLTQAGFPAIATTSAGIAFSLGRPDYDIGDARLRVSQGDMFARIREIVEASSLPVNGDLEAGYGDTPEAVADTIRKAIEIGLAGGNIEDKKAGEGLYDEALAVERIRAARSVIKELGSDFVLCARTDAFVTHRAEGLSVAIRRSNLYREAGADASYPPGVADIASIKTLVREIDGPVNIVIGLGGVRFGVRELLDAGVKRISLGGSIARSALGFVARSARELRDEGTIEFSAGQTAHGELNMMFATARRR
jgi:2-methylisocitrate lyase-like PEP mutase family enzyme